MLPAWLSIWQLLRKRFLLLHSPFPLLQLYSRPSPGHNWILGDPSSKRLAEHCPRRGPGEVLFHSGVGALKMWLIRLNLIHQPEYRGKWVSLWFYGCYNLIWNTNFAREKLSFNRHYLALAQTLPFSKLELAPNIIAGKVTKGIYTVLTGCTVKAKTAGRSVDSESFLGTARIYTEA